MNINDRLVGSRSRECVEQFYQTRLVRITHGAFAIWLNPFGASSLTRTTARCERLRNFANVPALVVELETMADDAEKFNALLSRVA